MCSLQELFVNVAGVYFITLPTPTGWRSLHIVIKNSLLCLRLKLLEDLTCKKIDNFNDIVRGDTFEHIIDTLHERAELMQYI